MKEIEIKAFTELHKAIEDYDARTVIYWGVRSVRFPLIPKIGREEPSEDDCVIYAYRNKSCIDVRKYTDPFKYNRVGKFIPKHLSRRITTQGGLFTIHPDPYEPVESKDMEKIIIARNNRSTLKKTLNKYGVDRFSLFPGLDSLAAHVEWLQSKGY